MTYDSDELEIPEQRERILLAAFKELVEGIHDRHHVGPLCVCTDRECSEARSLIVDVESEMQAEDQRRMRDADDPW